MLDVESIVNFDKWSATIFSVPFSSSISSCLKVLKIQESWLTSLCLVMTWGNGSIGWESVFSLQCSDLTPSFTFRDWLIIFLTRFKNGFFNNLTTVESNDWLDLIHMLASGATCTWIVLPFGILLWLRWQLTFLLKTES
jgi:hypothetical protein